MRKSSPGVAGADPSSDELREKLHERIEVCHMLIMAAAQGMIEVLLKLSQETCLHPSS